mgnify:CR=1 FL=1
MNAKWAATIEDLRTMALSYLPVFLSEFVEGGGGSGACVRRNIEAYDRYAFLTKSIVDVSTLRSERSVLGRTYATPFGFSAVANQIGRAHV